ncbi:hypothetical protein niasHT_011263 [Heterodera trifolii]|uniref:Tetraspanin n=1 Tax=Heterodera trifolii TaxID=157864 RepID=A0ABD2L6G4_9BILA
MVYGLGNQMLKSLFFLANFALFLFGCLLFAFSLWANLDQNFSRNLHDFAQQTKLDGKFIDEIAEYQAALWVLVAIGALLLVVGFLGCCGAACESAVLLTLFGAILLILSLIELYILFMMFTNRTELLDSVYKAFLDSAKTADGRRNLKPIQTALNCCGATLSTQQTYKSEGLCPDQLAKANACYAVVAAKVGSNDVLVCAILVLFVQLVAMLFSSTLSNAFRSHFVYSPIGQR